MNINFDALNKLDVESLNHKLVKACANGELELAETLLISPKLKINPDINANNNHPLRWSCIQNQTAVIKYLLSSPKLKKHADVHAMLDTPFKEALRHESEELLQFYIFDLRIEQTEFIKQALVEYSTKPIYQKVESMFQVRDLKETLPVNNQNEKSKPKL